MFRSEICYPKKNLENYNSLKWSYSDFTERISNDCNLELREEGSLPIFSNVTYVGPSVPHVLHRRDFEGVYQTRSSYPLWAQGLPDSPTGSVGELSPRIWTERNIIISMVQES